MTLWDYIATAAKAILAGLLAALSALGAFLVNNTSFGDITDGQWVYIAIAGLTAAAAVFGLPNKSND